METWPSWLVQLVVASVSWLLGFLSVLFLEWWRRRSAIQCVRNALYREMAGNYWWVSFFIKERMSSAGHISEPLVGFLRFQRFEYALDRVEAFDSLEEVDTIEEIYAVTRRAAGLRDIRGLPELQYLNAAQSAFENALRDGKLNLSLVMEVCPPFLKEQLQSIARAPES